MSVASYVEILRNIERNTASDWEWRQLSKKMVAALPRRLRQKYPLDLQDIPEEKRRPRRVKNSDAESSQSDHHSLFASDSIREKQGIGYKDRDVDQHEEDSDFSSLPTVPISWISSDTEKQVLYLIASMRICQTPWLHNCPRVLVPERKGAPFSRRNDRTRVCAFRAIKALTKTPFGNGMSGLRSETRFDISDENMGIEEKLVKVDSWMLAEGASQRLDWKTGQYNLDDLELWEDIDGQLEVYGPRWKDEDEDGDDEGEADEEPGDDGEMEEMDLDGW